MRSQLWIVIILVNLYSGDPATGATAEEKESAAFWMRHSNQMAVKVYTHLNCEHKLRLGMDLSTRINARLART